MDFFSISLGGTGFFPMTYNVIEASKERVPLKRLKFLRGKREVFQVREKGCGTPWDGSEGRDICN